MFLFGLESMSCGDKKRNKPSGNDGLSSLVRQDIEILNLWEDFKKVVKFIDDNFERLNPLMGHITHKKLSLE